MLNNPITNYSDLNNFNKQLQAAGLPQYEIVEVSSQEDKLVLKNGEEIVKLYLMETMVEFVTNPTYCFSNIRRLAKIDFSLLWALAFPKEFQVKLREAVNNLVLMGLDELELGKVCYSYKISPKVIKLEMKSCRTSQLNTLYLPSFVNAIPDDMFANSDDAPRRVVSYAKRLKIGKKSFFNCTTQEVIALNGIGELSYKSFSDSKLRRIILSDNLTQIPECAFSYCYDLESIKLPRNLKRISSGAFEASSLKDVDFSECSNLESIGGQAFSKISATELDLSSCINLNTIGVCAFSHCPNLKSINLRNCKNLVNMYDYAFEECSNLKVLDLRDTIVSACSLWTVVHNTSLRKLCCPSTYCKFDNVKTSKQFEQLKEMLRDTTKHSLSIENYPEFIIKGWVDNKFKGKSKPKGPYLAEFLKDIHYALGDRVLDVSINGMTVKDALKLTKDA